MTSTDPTVTDLLVPLAEIDDRGVYFEDSFTSWRDHVQHAAAIAATLRARLDPDKPPHVGVLLENTPFFSAVLTAAGMSGIVPAIWTQFRGWKRDLRRATMQVYNIAMQVTALTVYSRTGALDATTLKLFAVVAPAMLLPSYFGTRLYGRFSEKTFARVIFVLLLASGAALLVDGARGR